MGGQHQHSPPAGHLGPELVQGLFGDVHCLGERLRRPADGVKKVIVGLPGVVKDVARHLVQGRVVGVGAEDLAQVGPHRPVNPRLAAGDEVRGDPGQAIAQPAGHVLADKEAKLGHWLAADQILNAQGVLLSQK